MASVLITGGTGTLGKQLCAQLDTHGVQYQVGTRKSNLGEKYITMDLVQNVGVSDAIAGKEIIFHLATDMKKETVATQNLIRALGTNSDVHLIYISIVGIDKVPFPYYKRKLASENVIKQSGIPYTILRATQFHEFANNILETLLKYRVGFLPKKIVLQTIGSEVVASELYKISKRKAQNATNEIGGPIIQNLNQMCQIWLCQTHRKRWIINLPIPGQLGRTFKGGYLTTPNIHGHSSSYGDWLRRNPNRQLPK